MLTKTKTSPSIAGRLVLALKLDIPGITGQFNKVSLKRMEQWIKKLKMFSKAMEKFNLIPGKAMDLLKLAQSSMEVQWRSYKKIMEGKEREENLELKLYEIEVNLNGCLHLLQLKAEPEENPFFD